MMNKTAQIPAQDQYYLNIMRDVLQQATCMPACFGCIIVQDDQMIFTGYGGVPCKTKDGLEGENCVGHKLHIPLRRQYELCCSFHEEQNPIINATRLGVNLFFGNINAYGINKFIRGNIRHLPIPVLFTRK